MARRACLACSTYYEGPPRGNAGCRAGSTGCGPRRVAARPRRGACAVARARSRWLSRAGALRRVAALPSRAVRLRPGDARGSRTHEPPERPHTSPQLLVCARWRTRLSTGANADVADALRHAHSRALPAAQCSDARTRILAHARPLWAAHAGPTARRRPRVAPLTVPTPPRTQTQSRTRSLTSARVSPHACQPSAAPPHNATPLGPQLTTLATHEGTHPPARCL